MTASTEVKPEGSELSELMHKYDGDYSAPRTILGVVPIVAILVAWAAIFCVYGRQIIAAVAPLAR